MNFEELAEMLGDYQMSPEEKQAQRLSFVYGNVHISNPLVTREMVAEEAKRLEEAE